MSSFSEARHAIVDSVIYKVVGRFALEDIQPNSCKSKLLACRIFGLLGRCKVWYTSSTVDWVRGIQLPIKSLELEISLVVFISVSGLVLTLICQFFTTCRGRSLSFFQEKI